MQAVKSRQNLQHPAIGVVAASVLFGTSGTARSYLPEDASTLGIAALRLLVGAIPLLGFAFIVHRRSFRRPQRRVYLAGVAMAAFQVFFFQSISSSGVAVGTMVTIGSGPVVATVIDYCARRRIPRNMVLGILVALCGLVLLVFGSPSDDGVNLSVLGVASGVCAGACYALYTQLSKQLLDAGWTGPWVMAQSFSVSALLCLISVVFVPMGWATTRTSVLTIAYLGVATIAIPYLLYASSLVHLSSAIVVTLTLIEPVTATALGAFFLHEEIGIVSWCGAGIVLIGLIFSGLRAETATN